MKVLITGANGQLGRELLKRTPQHVTVGAYGRKQLDITNAEQVQVVFDEFQPDTVINAAAYTKVDDAQTEQAAAYAVNETGASNLALAAAKVGARYLLVSTDFVFDGSQGHLHRPDNTPNPQSVYGASKRAGEIAALDAIGGRTLVMRTSWLYSANGGNFVNSMLNLMRDKPELGIVADQVGSPTWAGGLATALWRCLDYPKLSGVWHYADAGVASWYDFAVAIQELAIERDILRHVIPIKPLSTEEFPRPAPRPAFSALDSQATYKSLKLAPKHWRSALATMLEEVAQQDSTETNKRAYA